MVIIEVFIVLISFVNIMQLLSSIKCHCRKKCGHSKSRDPDNVLILTPTSALFGQSFWHITFCQVNYANKLLLQ